jgi:hypothetical protein
MWEGDALLPLTPERFLRVPMNDEGYKIWSRELEELWTKEYLIGVLGSLDSRIWKTRESSVKVGDVVLIELEGRRRVTWPLAVIEQLVQSGDGQVRGAVVRTGKGRLRRPLQKIFKLECEQTRVEDEEATPDVNDLVLPIVEEEDVVEEEEVVLEEEVAHEEEVDLEEEVATTRRGRKVKRPAHLRNFLLD